MEMCIKWDCTDPESGDVRHALIKGKMLVEFTYVSGWEGVSKLQDRDRIKNYFQLGEKKKREASQPKQLQT